jgi:triosephosphate isomerase
MPLNLIANWKLNGSKAFNQKWTENFLQHYTSDNFSSIGVTPTSIYIEDMIKLIGGYGINIGAQNIDTEDQAARTGEISASMIKDTGCSFSLIGHSERRDLFYESNQMINQKLIQASQHSLSPILCIGESAEENKQNLTFEVLQRQLTEALNNSKEISSISIAYEPVWAIGSGQTPEPHDVNSIHEMIKDVVQSRFSHIGLDFCLIWRQRKFN